MRTSRDFANMLKLTISGLAVSVAVIPGAMAREAHFDIAAQPLSSAIAEFSRQSGETVMAPSDLIGTKVANPVRGAMEPRAALVRLLDGAGLRATSAATGSFIIERVSAQSSETAMPIRAARPVQLAQAAPDAAAAPGAIDEIVVTATRREESLSRVPVSVSAFSPETLERANTTNLQDLQRSIPGLVYSDAGRASIRGISSAAGAPTSGIYINDSPIQMLNVGYGSNNIVPTVFDLERVEVLRGPQGTLFGASAQAGVIRFITPTPSLTDWSFMARSSLGQVEGGAQDFELGAAVGGPIVVDKLGFRANAVFNRKGGWINGLDYQTDEVNARNINGSENFSTRIALLWEPTEGLRIKPAVHYQRFKSDGGGRLTATGTMHEWASNLKEGIFNFEGISTVLPAKDDWVMPTLEVNYDFGDFATLTSTTTYLDRLAWNSVDTNAYYIRQYHSTLYSRFLPQYQTRPLLSTTYGYWMPYPEYYGYGGTYNNMSTFAQEIRLASSNPESPLQWTIGGFHHKTKNVNIERYNNPNDEDMLLTLMGPDTIYGPNPYVGYFRQPLIVAGVGYELYAKPGNPRDVSDDGIYWVEDSQMAAFGEASYNITEEFKVTLGLRYSVTKYEFENYLNGPISRSGVVDRGEGRTKQKPVTPKFGVSYQFDEGNMLYATVAKGFRIGGANAAVPVEGCREGLNQLGYSEFPRTFNSDTTWSYEIGSKNRLFDGRMQLASSVFYIKWDDIQQRIGIPVCGYFFVKNAATAVSKGFDIDLNANVFTGTSVNLAVGYTNAKYTADTLANPAAPNALRPYLIRDGSRLDGPDWKVALGVQYDWSMMERDFFVRGDWQYAHVSPGEPQQDPLIASYDANIPKPPSTDYFTARAGVNLGSVDVALFVDNLLNSRERLTRAHSGSTNPIYTITTWRPRTYTLSLRYQY